MRRVVGAVGRVFITVGLLILLFVAYQLWGTGLYTAREQDELERQFTSALASEGAGDADDGLDAVDHGARDAEQLDDHDDHRTARHRLRPRATRSRASAIPKIGVDSIVVNGVNREDLRKGPGHYPDTPLPGQEGNSAIAGHRTTYGAPFGDLDQLSEGDLIQVRTLQGSFEYRVSEQLDRALRPTSRSSTRRPSTRPTRRKGSSPR